MDWSDKQLEILNGSGNMLVSASAGSGKTTVMIEKIRRLISNGASLKNMVICTFTTAAAAEMRGKLGMALAEGGFREQLEYLPQADIATLHGVCARLIRTYFYRTDADPAFELLREGEASAMRAECLTAVLERAEGEKFRLLYDALLVNRGDDALRTIINKIYMYSRTRPDGEGWLDRCTRMYSLTEAVCGELKARFAQRRVELGVEIDKLRRMTAEAGFKRNVPLCEKLRDWLFGLEEPFRLPSSKTEEKFCELNEQLKALKEKVKRFLENESEALSAPPASEAAAEAELLVGLVKEFSAEYSEQKRRKGKLDFSDLEHYALEILESESGEEIRNGIKYVFVDEYQDINPLQEEIIRLLSGKAELFEVGDVKQSIYAFRLCDPGIFTHKYRSYRRTGGGKAIDLTVNYRSASGVVDGVNDVFRRAMTEEFGGVDYSGAELVCGRETDGEKVRLKIVADRENAPRAAIYSVRDDAGGTGKRHAQAAAAAADIADLLEGTITENGKTRPIMPGDIAVISRSRTQTLDELYVMLKSLGIPAAYAVKGRSQDSVAVRPLINMLRLIDNRSDDIMLAACLKSRFGGFTDDELADIRRSGGGSFSQAVSSYRGPLEERLKAFSDKLDRYEELAARLPADETAGIIVSEAEYFEYLYSEDDGEALAAALSRFLKLAGEVAVTIRDLIDYTDQEPEDNDYYGGGDCVKLMTAHASKGLEFNYVIILDADREFRMDDASGTVLTDDEYGLVVKKFDYEARETVKTALYYLASEAVRKRMREEELRILYVAMTRAKEKLYIYAADKKQSDEATCWLGWLKNALEPEYVTAEESEKPLKSRIASRPDRQLAAAVRKKLEFVYPYGHLPQKTTVTALAESEDETSDVRYIGASTDSERAAEVGTAYHLIMENMDFYAGFDGEWDRLSAEFPHEAEMCDREKIRAAACAMAELAKGKTAYREQPFIMDDGGTLVQGVIDLLLIGGDGAVIVDYKTTRSYDLTTPAYVFQTNAYARAVRRLLGIPVRAVYLYSFFADKTIEMPFTE